MRARPKFARRAADRAIATAQRGPQGVIVDYSKPVPIPYVCGRCQASRARMVPLREVVHQNYVAPKLCPVCDPERGAGTSAEQIARISARAFP